MVDRDILLAKIASIRKCLERIRTVTGGVSESLNDPDIQDIFVLNLQRAVQATIDLAAHLVADEKIGLPTETEFNCNQNLGVKLCQRTFRVGNELDEFTTGIA